MAGDTTSIDTYDEIEKAIVVYFDAYWTFTSVQYPNTLFDPENLDAWVQIHIIPTEKTRLCMTGNTSTGLWTKGTVIVNIFVRPNTGTGTLQSYVTKAASLFNYTELTVTTGQTIKFGVANTDSGFTNGNWYQKTVKSNFDLLI